MKRRIAAVVPALVAIVVAGCGGGHATVKAGHPCSQSDAVMQCELPSTHNSGTRAVRSIYGIDFAWSSVSAARARALGARFGASYLSTDTSKNWSRASVNAYHAAGLATVAVWETAATRAQDGFAAGVSDANAAKAQAAALGDTGAIDFAVDCPCAPSSVLGYFQGVHRVLGNRGNAYGDYAVIAYLHAHGVVGNDNWQTYAWSAGAWLPASIAPLEQYLNGSSFDNDRALRADYGQWPAPARPAVVRCYHRRMSPAACKKVRARVARDVRAAASSERAWKARGCGVLSQRVRWFRGHLRRYPHVKAKARGRALVASERAFRERSCRVFAQRERWFAARASTLERAN